jgi:hypothetical protein
MKGIVFREFLDMVEHQFGLEVADRIIEESHLPSEGAYTTVGSYDHHELIQLVSQLNRTTQLAVPDLIRAFGQHLFGRFVAGYPQFFVGIESAFGFLERVDGIVHVEVRKLYPDAELPTFECATAEGNRLTMTYHSQRPFADLAEGLIRGCIAHYHEDIEIHRDDPSVGERGTCVRFMLTKRSTP